MESLIQLITLTQYMSVKTVIKGKCSFCAILYFFTPQFYRLPDSCGFCIAKSLEKSVKLIYTANIKTDHLILAFEIYSYLCSTESKWSVSFLTLFSPIRSHWPHGEHFAWAGWSSATELFSMLPTDRCWARLLKEKKYSGTKITRRHIKPTRLFVVSCIRAQKFCTEIINMKSTWWKIKFPLCVSFLCLKALVHCFLNRVQPFSLHSTPLHSRPSTETVLSVCTLTDSGNKSNANIAPRYTHKTLFNWYLTKGLCDERGRKQLMQG